MTDYVTAAFNFWYEKFVEQGGSPGKGVDYIVQQAHVKAAQYRELGTAYDDFQPGNGTSYKLVLHDLSRPWLTQAFPDMFPLGDKPLPYGWTEADLWESASRHTMTQRAGGELLVSLPDNNGGMCGAFSVYAYSLITPDYIHEKLKCGLADAVPLAVYLTAFINKVAELRARAGAEVSA